MIEQIEKDGRVIGIFVPGTFTPEKTRFITKNEEPLQWGIGVFAKGATVEPHRHVGSPTQISEFQEFIMIRRGKVAADVFDEWGDVVRSFVMLPGDALLLLRGGHGFRFLEDTELLEVKQGPYQGREKMKELIQTVSANTVSPPTLNSASTDALPL